MHHRAKDISGQKHDYLTAVRYTGSDGKKSLWLIACDCGKEFIMPASEFTKGKQKSCGCMRKILIGEGNTRHGMAGHPAYFVWRSMVDRCSLPTHQAWGNYGGRGIRVCACWLEKFENFWADMGRSYEPGLTLERQDVNGDYCPENCTWATYKAQGRNKRNNRYMNTPQGRMTVSEAAETHGIGLTTLLYRIEHDWPEELLFSTPDVRNRFTTSSTADREIDLLS